MMDERERDLFVGIWEQLKRIADALDRAYPFPELRDLSQVKPADIGDFTVVTPALREKWAKEEAETGNLDSPLTTTARR